MMSMSITRTSLTRAFFRNSFLEGHKGIYELAQGGSGLCNLGHYPSSRLFLSLTWEPHCTVLGKSKSLHMIGMCRLQALYRESTLSLASPCNVADEQREARWCKNLFITPYSKLIHYPLQQVSLSIESLEIVDKTLPGQSWWAAWPASSQAETWWWPRTSSAMMRCCKKCTLVIQGDFFNWPPPKNHKF